MSKGYAGDWHGGIQSPPAPARTGYHRIVLEQLMPIDLGDTHKDDMYIEGKHLDDAEFSAEDIIKEMFPDTTKKLITAWERIYNVTPRPADTLTDRRERIINLIHRVGGVSRMYFLEILLALGHPEAVIDDTIGNYQWRITLDGPEDPEIVSIINTLKPAHTAVQFVWL